ncbi:MAG: isoprenyl transferase [Candidatus Cloacimonetes bacterium]|nr:isoprenyl transferase [Candidatus Cloacimonadota bacterium]
MDYKEMLASIDKSRVPQHIAIIMDGNGRWAKKRLKNRLFGHRAGAQTIREVVECGVDFGLKYLTVYAFSAENWNRPEAEIKGLFKLLLEFLKKEIDEIHANNVCVKLLGSEERLDPAYLASINNTLKLTWNNTGLQLRIAFNYGGRQDIVQAVKKISQKSISGEIDPESINQELIESYLYTRDMPDPDLLIRTSGELRISNFLIWQIAYAEMWFTDKLWPDFTRVDMVQAVLDFQNRNRRFGAL